MRTVAVTNAVGSTVTREVDESRFIRASPEIGVAATKTFVTTETAVIAFLTDATNPHDTLHNAKEVEARGASVIGLSTLDDADTYCAETIDIPEIGVLEPVVANVAMQLFAYHIAKDQGRNIDKPRNLAKSVTVK